MTAAAATTDPPRAGNKLSDEHENPVDILFLRLGDCIRPALRSTGHTPNVITTYSFVCGLASVYALYRGRVPAFAVLFLLSYFFDCVDGQYARAYGMTTEWGDWYDHATDVVVLALLAVVVTVRYRAALTPAYGVAAAAVVALMLVNFGCQQRAYAGQRPPETLDAVRGLCPSDGMLPWTRFFGSGTAVVAFVLFIVHLHARVSTGSRPRPRRSPPAATR
jgi:phosphatidylglycerophosphate synthase